MCISSSVSNTSIQHCIHSASSAKVTGIFSILTRQEWVKVLVLDDSVVKRIRSKAEENQYWVLRQWIFGASAGAIPLSSKNLLLHPVLWINGQDAGFLPSCGGDIFGTRLPRPRARQ